MPDQPQHLPAVSAIIPVLNEERRLARCLDILRAQDYPQDKLEIIVVDDGSTDTTVAVAERFGASVIVSGQRHIERSKSLGLEQASGELVLLIDADVFLVGTDWLRRAVAPFLEQSKIAGAQSVVWQYRRAHHICNRYCELFGTNDPLVYYLTPQVMRTPLVDDHIYQPFLLQARPDYSVVRFDLTHLPTLGSQGYLGRKDLILSQTDWQPYFFHLDHVYQLVSSGWTDFALLQLPVEHDYVDSLAGFYRKLYRNLELFLQFRPQRRYTYRLGSIKFFWSLLLMMTVIHPLWQSLRGMRRRPDPAWLLHPLFCLTVPCWYAVGFVWLKCKKFF